MRANQLYAGTSGNAVILDFDYRSSYKSGNNSSVADNQQGRKKFMIRKGKLEEWAEQWQNSAKGFKDGAEEVLVGDYSKAEKRRARGRLQLGKNWLELVQDLQRTFGLRPAKKQ